MRFLVTPDDPAETDQVDFAAGAQVVADVYAGELAGVVDETGDLLTEIRVLPDGERSRFRAVDDGHVVVAAALDWSLEHPDAAAQVAQLLAWVHEVGRVVGRRRGWSGEALRDVLAAVRVSEAWQLHPANRPLVDCPATPISGPSGGVWLPSASLQPRPVIPEYHDAAWGLLDGMHSPAWRSWWLQAGQPPLELQLWITGQGRSGPVIRRSEERVVASLAFVIPGRYPDRHPDPGEVGARTAVQGLVDRLRTRFGLPEPPPLSQGPFPSWQPHSGYDENGQRVDQRGARVNPPATGGS